MPVLVTSAHTALGQRTVAAIAALGGQVRAYVSGTGDVAALRRAGAIVATGDALDTGHLESAMEQVHTVVHLGPGLLAASVEAIEAEAAAVTEAARGAGVSRFVTLSAPGAAAEADDAYRRALASVEALVEALPLPSVVVRASLIDSDELHDALAASRPSADALATPLAPLDLDTVADAFALVDDLRSTAREGHVVLGLAGPEVTTLAEYLERSGVGLPGAVGRLVGRVWRGADAAPLLHGALAGPWIPEAGLPDVLALRG